MSDKISPKHLERKAILYVRQSTPHQLINNKESQRLQYGMQDKLRSIGWRDIEIIDEDLGRSAAGSTTREGFRRMVADVGLGKVGIIAARELSRFARNSPEWQQLVGICRMTDTLLLDHDGIYDARLGNDCLLLGLKGTISEYEIELFRLRAVEARRQKARRGEYYARIPAGFCKTDGRLEKDPDRRVRETIDLLFTKFFELGSVRQMVLWLANHKIEVPRNQAQGVAWKPVSYGHAIKILKNPLYAGAYAFGMSEPKTRLQNGTPRKSIVRKRIEDWSTLILDHHEGYISWAQFERIQKMISNNDQIARKRGVAPGAAKKGAALLAGLARCRRCGRMLATNYSGSKRTGRYVQRYTCHRANMEFGQPSCVRFSAVEVDRRIASELLTVVEPLALEAAVRAHEQSQQVQGELHSVLVTQLEEARYRADLAGRRFDAIDPANRLVADELERRWNEALENIQTIESKIRQAEEERSRTPPPPVAAFTDLAADLNTVWESASPEIRTRIVRTLIQEVIVDIDDAAREIVLVIHWKGGIHTELRVPMRKRGYQPMRTPIEVIDAIRLLARICTDDQIARWLSQSRGLTATGLEWSRQLVAGLRNKHEIPRFSKERKEAEGWLTQKEAARLISVAEVTLRRAVERGDLAALRPVAEGPWLIKKSDLLEAQAAHRIKKRSAGRQRVSGQNLQQLLPGISKR